MGSLLDKFATIQIEADQRISNADKEFCQRQQEAFDKSGPALQKIADMVIAAQTEQKKILEVDKDDFYKTYLVCDNFECNRNHIYKAMKKRNKTFITTIVEYFCNKYKVKLNGQRIMEHLIPAGPKEPKLPWGGYRQMNNEEIDAFNREMDAYKKEKVRYEQSLRKLPLRYEQVVDEIFAQLGGFSFQERAMNEFLSKCWDASHSRGSNKEEFEVKNKTLRLTGYWCSCRDDGWRKSCPDWEAKDDLKVILDALVHYSIGQLSRGAEWFPELFRYSTKENVFPIDNLRKIKSVKLFKNGRVDIKFEDAASAQNFVDNYLRKQTEARNND